MEFLPILPATPAATAGSARQRCTTRPASVRLHVTELACYTLQAGGFMKQAVRTMFILGLLLLAASFCSAEPRQLIQGTQIRMKLLGDIGTETSHNGDPFIAVTTEQVIIGDQVVLPAGTRIRGIVTSISRARRF